MVQYAGENINRERRVLFFFTKSPSGEGGQGGSGIQGVGRERPLLYAL